jgi:hypothetical protein
MTPGLMVHLEYRLSEGLWDHYQRGVRVHAISHPTPVDDVTDQFELVDGSPVGAQGYTEGLSLFSAGLATTAYLAPEHFKVFILTLNSLPIDSAADNWRHCLSLLAELSPRYRLVIGRTLHSVPRNTRQGVSRLHIFTWPVFYDEVVVGQNLQHSCCTPCQVPEVV